MTARCGFVALAGAPNAGKSTLLNAAVGAKVSIVTHKVQTTRTRLRGVAVQGETQIVFVDTPGIFEPKRRLDRAMVAAAWSGVADADVAILIHDAQRQTLDDPETQAILEGFRALRGRKILAINKIDQVKPAALLPLAAAFQAEVDFERTFMISALSGDGLKDLMEHLEKTLPEGPWAYPEDQLSDLPMRLIAAEVVREKLMLTLHQELPYQLTVETDTWEEFEDGSAKIEETIYVARDTHKKIVIGKGGQTIKRIRETAQNELQAMLERPVHLFLYVKVREKWQDDPERYREWGLDFKA
jgi:GTP-binding protein Era